MNQLPKDTAKIFEILNKGSFISSNSSRSEMRDMYQSLDNSFDDLKDYFQTINFDLERGSDYFYFTRPEIKVEIERKLETAYKWIDILDFFKAVNPTFGPGSKLSPSSIAEQCKVNSDLKLKLEGMRKITGDENIVQRIKKLILELKKDEFVELENELLDVWKVLDAIRYVENLISLINIPMEDETAN